MSIGNGTRLGLAGFIGPLLLGRCIRRKARPSTISWRSSVLQGVAREMSKTWNVTRLAANASRSAASRSSLTLYFA